MTLRELFKVTPKNFGDASALVSLRSTVQEKMNRFSTTNFDTEEKGLYILLANNVNLTNYMDSLGDTIEKVANYIIEVNKKFFNELTPEIIHENELEFLHYCSKKSQTSFKNLFMSIFKELSCFYKEAPAFFTCLRNKIPELNQYITQSKEMMQLFLLKCMRFTEDPQNAAITKGISKRESNIDDCANARFFIITILPRTSPEQMSRELLRFKVTDLLLDFNISVPQHFSESSLIYPASPQVLQSYIPTFCEKMLLANGGNITTLLSDLDRDQRTGFLCDCIRWSLNLSNFQDPKERASFVHNILHTSDNNLEIVNILLSLSLEYLTFNRDNKEDEIICLTLINVIRIYERISQTTFLDFIETIAIEFPIFAEGIAKAQQRTNKKMRFKKLVLPQVEAEIPQIDLKKELGIIQNKLKWNRGHTLDLSQLISMVEPTFGKLKFTFPLNNSEDLNLVLQSDVRIVSSMCCAFPVIFQYYIFNNPTNTQEITDIATQMLEEKSQALINTFVMAISLVPEIIDVISGMSSLLEARTDVSEIIRVACHHCTIDELDKLMKTPFFTQPGEQTNLLFKASTSWHRIAQTAFWHIVAYAFDVNHRSYILNAVIETSIHFSNIGRIRFSNILSSTPPSAENLKAVGILINKSDTWQQECVKILTLWAKVDMKLLTKNFQIEKDSASSIKSILKQRIGLSDNMILLINA